MDSINERNVDFINGKKRVLGELLTNGLIEPGQYMNYEQFLRLYSSYKYLMNEQEFAETLEINIGRLWRIKKGAKTKILKSIQADLERINNIRETDLKKACIEMLNKYNKLGISKKQAIEKTVIVLGISPEVLLKIMQDYQAEQKRVKVTQNRGVILGG